MSGPMSPDTFVSVLRAEGVRVAEYPGWKTRERDAATGKPFGPVHMILNHHTAGSSSLKMVAETGRPGLPAPLAHIHLAKTGVATMCSAGRANHAGFMGKNAYDSFLSESSTHPKPSSASGTVDGNDVSYGIEVENLGDMKDRYTISQYDALVRINAAIARHYGWSANSCAGHLETSVEGKIDPRGPVQGYSDRGSFSLTMNQLRSDVAQRLTHPNSWNPGGITVAITDADALKIAKALLDYDGIPASRPPHANDDYATNPYWTVRYALQAAVEAARTAASLTVPLSDAQVATIAEALGSSAGLADLIARKVADNLAARLDS